MISDKSSMTTRTSLASWQALVQQADIMKKQHIKQLFDNDQQRFEKLSLILPHLLLDYSKNLLDDKTLSLLLALADDCKLTDWRAKMLAGEHINRTEDRAVLHTALRNQSTEPFVVDGTDLNQEVNATLAKMAKFTETVRSGEWLGFSQKAITDVVSIGIGGSNLGPYMVTEALDAESDGKINIHYVSNVDGSQIANVLTKVNPETTLFVISSKTFTTSETMTNARTAMHWLVKAADGDKSAIAKHFIAVSTNQTKVVEFGIDADNIFDMWDWVGGRFSLWSAIGLPIAIYLGFDKFTELLAGAKEMDEHFEHAPLAENGPVILALLSIWNCTFLGASSQAILPYDQSLHRLPAYLQQAEMESNGKSVNWQGDTLDYTSVPGLWGEVGINGQHAFYQYLHQGNTIVPADFIGSIKPTVDVEGHHNTLMSNFFAQTEALMKGVNEQEVRQQLKTKGLSDKAIEQLAKHKVHQGNRPTNSLLLDKITPRSLGALIALYEHKIFVQGVILEIHSFDQWGVELGKGLASNIEQELNNKAVDNNHDSSTQGLLNYYLNKQ